MPAGQLSSISFYLPLSSSISFFLQLRQLALAPAGARGTVTLLRDNRLVLSPYGKQGSDGTQCHKRDDDYQQEIHSLNSQLQSLRL